MIKLKFPVFETKILPTFYLGHILTFVQLNQLIVYDPLHHLTYNAMIKNKNLMF